MSTTTTASAFGDNQAIFIRSRLGSFLAVVPLGAWTTHHIWSNLAAFRGAEAWEEAVTSYSHTVAQLGSAVLALLPLVLHTAWGIGRLFTARVNYGRYGYYNNFKYLLQRLSAVGILLFVGAHLYLAMIQPRFIHGHPEAFADIAREMHHHTPTLVVYLLGTLGVCYHLANGLQTFCMGWGIVSTKQALRRLDLIAISFFIVLLTMAWSAIGALYQAGTNF